jgi:hypothetical protein
VIDQSDDRSILTIDNIGCITYDETWGARPQEKQRKRGKNLKYFAPMTLYVRVAEVYW